MRFGGHETFAVREGWLTKGLRVLVEEPEKLVEEFAEDHLGVGRNMVKSIRHWLVATGLAAIEGNARSKTARYAVTPFGELVWLEDPHMLDLGTWWALHVNLINNDEQAATWYWFFNSFNMPRFERPVCIESLHRHLRLCQKRVPSRRTLERDVACLLSSYSSTVPRQRNDPEDAAECPFSELRLLTHFKGSGYYQIDRGNKHVSPRLLGFCLARSSDDARRTKGSFEIPLTKAARLAGGPGRAFQLTAEGLFDMVTAYESDRRGAGVRLVGLAGERVLQVDCRPDLEWLREYYSHACKKHKAA